MPARNGDYQMSRKIEARGQIYTLRSTSKSSDEKSYDVFDAAGSKIGDVTWGWLRTGGAQWVIFKNNIQTGCDSLLDAVLKLTR